MERFFWIAAVAFSCFWQMAAAVEKLSEKYLVSYGDPAAPIKIVEYFSFQCPHCLALFRKDFKAIEEQYINSKKVYWVFHPIPTDLVTLQGMVCMATLDEHHKKLYIETLLAEAEFNNPEINALIMAKVMEIFKKPIQKLRDEEFLQQTDAFLDAFSFLTQEEKILLVPTIEVNGTLFPKEVPDLDFVKTVVN